MECSTLAWKTKLRETNTKLYDRLHISGVFKVLLRLRSHSKYFQGWVGNGGHRGATLITGLKALRDMCPTWGGPGGREGLGRPSATSADLPDADNGSGNNSFQLWNWSSLHIKKRKLQLYNRKPAIRKTCRGDSRPPQPFWTPFLEHHHPSKVGHMSLNASSATIAVVHLSNAFWDHSP